MNQSQKSQSKSLRAITAVCALGLFILLPSLTNREPVAEPAGPVVKENKYIGSAKCENCHSAEASGDQYGKWSKAPHHKAFETLKGKEAKEAGAKHGVEDPSKSEKCLKCHVTGYGLDKKLFKKSFDPEEGVGCEACHGPGDNHAKARFRAANEESDEEGFGEEEGEAKYTEIPEGEIIAHPGVDTCIKCHNEESPTFKEFCYFHREQKIRHINPLKPRTKEEKDALKGCDCKDEIKCEHKCSEKCTGKKDE
ncbi:MAG: cytochrome c family protein [Planctomycetes bacterium]|nr:cytochrome c family protein [Planctomycetota bacterium]